MNIKTCEKCGKPKIRKSDKEPDFCQCDFVYKKTKEMENKIDYQPKFECKRCGRCCMHMRSDDSGMPCEHLLVKNGIATCLIYEARPEVCRQYPDYPDFGSEPCFFEQYVM